MLMPETLSPTRATISEESGILRISIPMRRDWAELIFLTAWFGLWIFLARSSFHAAGKDFGPAWLGLWILAAVWVLRTVLRKLAGRDVMAAGTKIIGVRKKILGIGLTQQYEVAEISYLHFDRRGAGGGPTGQATSRSTAAIKPKASAPVSAEKKLLRLFRC